MAQLLGTAFGHLVRLQSAICESPTGSSPTRTQSSREDSTLPTWTSMNLQTPLKRMCKMLSPSWAVASNSFKFSPTQTSRTTISYAQCRGGTNFAANLTQTQAIQMSKTAQMLANENLPPFLLTSSTIQIDLMRRL